MKPNDWFKSKGYGSLRKCAKELGYHEAYLCNVISLRVQPSLFFIDCLNKYCNTNFTECNFKQGKRRYKAEGSISKQFRADGTVFFQIYFCQKYLGVVQTETDALKVLEDYKFELLKTIEN